MAFTVVRSLLNASRISANNKVLLNPVSKSLFRYDVKNTRTLTRSLFFLCRSRDSDNLSNVSIKALSSNKCSCGCFLHTKGDKELAAFLAEEIDNETKADPFPDVKVPEGFECDFKNAEVTLRKKMENEIITIKSNVSNSVDADEMVMDPNEDKEPQESEMKSKPEFTIEIQKGKRVLSFVCTYSTGVTDQVPQEYNDVFQITEVSIYEGEFDDDTYSVSGEIIDGYLYDLLMNYLEERGISNQFAEKMVSLFTSYEHKLYVNLLKGMKAFVEK